MTAVCDLEALEALVADTLSPGRASEVQSHARSCVDCGRELAWLRTERRLMTERKNAEPGLPPDLWRQVESRIAGTEAARAPARPPGRGGFLARFAFPVFTGAAALAAALLLLFRAPADPERRPMAGRAGVPPVAAPSSSEPSGVPVVGGVNEVLDAALAEYEQAAVELEGNLRRSRVRLPAAEAEALERRFAPARRGLSLARTGAGRDLADPEARLRALDDYADYVRSLQAVVLALDGGGR